MWMIHVTYPGGWVCMCARGGTRRWAHSLAQHTYIYTYIHVHTGCLCASEREGGGRWCCITWEWVGNAALIHVWMHRVIYMNVSVSSWTSASRKCHYLTRKIVWCPCHQQPKKQAYGHIYVWMNRWTFRPMRQGTAMIQHTQNGVTSHCCPPQKKKYTGTYMNMSVKSRDDDDCFYYFQK